MSRGAVIAALCAAAAAGALFLGLRPEPQDAGGKPRGSPGGKPIDAAQITAGTLPFKVMPPEVTSALEMHTNEIVKTAELVETKQARITGVCAPGSAIRLVGQDGSVVCQRLPKGVV